MSAPSNYRRQRIVEFTERLIWKKEHLRQQLKEEIFADQTELIRGQMQALDSTIREIMSEFEISTDEFR